MLTILPPCCVDHLPRHRRATKKGAVEIEGDTVRPGVRRDFLGFAEGDAAYVVHENIDAAERIQCAGDHPLDLHRIGDIGGNGHRLPALLQNFRDHPLSRASR